MKTYSIDTYRKYINGEDADIPLEELERDFSFMKTVIDITNDPNMVKMCSKELLYNYEFIKFVVYKFKDRDDLFKSKEKKEDYLSEVAGNFILKSKNYEGVFDIAVRMINIIKNEYNICHQISVSVCLGNYHGMLYSIEKFNEKNTNGRISIGKGFYFVEEEYEEYEEIKNYFAQMFLSEIFNEENVDIKNDLHNHFKTAKKVEEYGAVNYILNHVQRFDSPLKGYLATHLDLLDKYTNKVKEYLDNWNYDEKQIMTKKYDKIFEDVHKYMELCYDNSTLSEVEILYYVAKQLGIEEELADYDCVNTIITEEIVDTISDSYIKGILNKSIKDYTNYRCVLNIVKEIISCDNIDKLIREEDDEDLRLEYFDQPTARSRVIKYDFKNNKEIDNRG